MREAAELTSNPSPDYHATPLESDLFEWHFTLRGPSDSAYSQGIYHGRITLPTQYPLRPPSFRFLTPSARFECNREICLSISGFHEETWQPAWGIRTALIALRSHMDVPAKGQVGGIESDDNTRRRLAGESRPWKCATCGKSNLAILEEQEQLAKEAETEGATTSEEKVPEELKLVYKDDLKGKAPAESAAPERPMEVAGDGQSPPAVAMPRVSAPVLSAPPAAPRPAPAQPVRQQAPPAQQRNGHADDVQLDAAIWVVSGILIILISRMLVKMFS